MEKNRRPKKLTLRSETLRLLEADRLPAAKGGYGTSDTSGITTIFSEGHCETYTWIRRCPS